MIGSIEGLSAAIATFVLGHFILSSLQVRRNLTSLLTEGGFSIGYTIVISAALIWVLYAYGAAPFIPVWDPAPDLRHVTYSLMLVSVLFVVIGLSTRSPTAVGGEKLAQDPRPVTGILTITRHPFLIGTSLWSIAHLLSNGDLASILLFGGMLVLSTVGMAHIDYRRKHNLGAAWAPIALSTSVVPFVAALSGRVKIDWSGIGVLRPAIGLAVFMGLALGHPWIAGVALF